MSEFKTYGEAFRFCIKKGFAEFTGNLNGYELAEQISNFEKEIRQDQKNRCINAIMNGQDIIRTHGLKRSSIAKSIMETD